MIENDTDFTWGYAPAIEAAQMDSCPAIWGARVIAIEDPGFGIVPGRVSWYTEDMDARRALVAALNKGILDACRERFAELKRDHWDIHRVAKEYVLYEDEAIKVVGNTNASFGYLYLAAFIKPNDWTGDWAGDWRPVSGNPVNVRVNNIGHAVVLRGHRSFTVAGLYVMPTSPPDWYRKQNRLGSKGWMPCWITGVEFDNINRDSVACNG
jgi:hypothetical protein